MATLYGGAMPDDFVSGEQLTATEFNKVKNYWIVDGDLPEGPEILDGDVVFVLGDADNQKVFPWLDNRIGLHRGAFCQFSFRWIY